MSTNLVQMARHLASVGDNIADARNRPVPYSLMHVGQDIEEAARALNTAATWWALAAREEGKTWQQIADTLGITRQAAQQRYGTMLTTRPML